MEENLFKGKEIEIIENKTEWEQKKVVFKPYEIGENYLFPATTDEYISKTHIARLISLIIDRMNIRFILENYKGGGASSYNPRMMLKVWILGFIYKIYTSRKLELAMEENLAFIWISANQMPDFRTLNNFRKLLKVEIKEIFKQIVILGMGLGIIEGKDIFVDHTKFEANANRHKITWKKTVDRQLGKIEEELETLFKYIEELNEAEDKKYGDSRIKEKETGKYEMEDIEEMVNKLDKIIKEKEITKEEKKEGKKKLRRIKELKGRKGKYNFKKKTLEDRNSFSNTDTDATAMMQKDKVSIKPSYNEGIAVENGFVISYEESQANADNVSFKDIVDGALENINKGIENIHADAAYGNEENSEYLEEKEINNYLKFNTYRKEKSKKWHREKVRKEDFRYSKEGDYYICPNNIKLYFECESTKATATGYKSKVRIYKAEEGKCISCPYKKYCTESERRSIQINEKYEEYKEIMRKNLESEKGKELRKRRGFEVESIFGDRKYNRQFSRFNLRGLENVNIESGLYYTAHNIRKIYSYMQKNWFNKLFNRKLLLLNSN
jgi:transposase